MATLALSRRPDQIAVITFDSPGSTVNTLSREVLADLTRALDDVLRDPKIKGCVLASAKADCFIAGANLDEIAEVQSAPEAEKVSRGLQDILNRIANGPIPFVAAIHGAALGGGLEVALACRSRVATDDPKTILGLPEVQLGLLPGAGGTQRLVRTVGLRQGLPMILGGTRVRAKKAARMGLVDKIVEKPALLETAAQMALQKKSRRPLPFVDRLLEKAPTRGFLFRQTRQQVLGKTRGNYPAPLAILKCIEAGLSRGMDAGLAVESREFGKLVISKPAKNLIWIFQATTAMKKGAKHPINTLGVLGAGLMGEGIASVSLPLNNVVLKDISEQSLKKAQERITTSLDKRVLSGALTQAKADEQKKHLSLSTDAAAFSKADLVIEAVFEELKLKRKVLAEAEAVMPAKAVFASNTSALPIQEIAKNAEHPERVLGMHYFSPVPKMPLLEIIVPNATADWATEQARSYGIAQGKTVIVVKDGPGFYTTRILAPLLNESLLLIEEGATMEAVDSAMKKFGFPVGPIALIDEVGIDVGMHVAHDLGLVFGSRWGRTCDALDRMVKAGYLGKKNGKTFYTAKKKPNTAAYGFFGDRRQKDFAREEISSRIAFMMVNEAVHCLQEGVISSPRDGDMGAIMGLGFPPFLGGPFHYLDALSPAKAVEQMKELSAKHGPRFEPAPLLAEKAQKGQKFYESRLL